MKSKFFKLSLGVVCAMVFFMLSFTSVSANQTVTENQVTVSNLSEFESSVTTDVADWWAIITSNYIIAGSQ